MLIKSVTLVNFRCYRDATLNCDRLTAILGRNGTGKSTLLHALDLFFNVSATVTDEDYYNNNTDAEIEIRVVFSNLQPEAVEEFETLIVDNCLAVSKRFDSSKQAAYTVDSQQIPELAEAIRESNETKRRNSVNELINAGNYSDFDPPIRSSDRAKDRVAEYTAKHPEMTEVVPEPVELFGPKNNGEGGISNYIKWIYVPAVHEVSEDFADKRGTPLKQLMELFVEQRFELRPDVQEFVREYEEKFSELYSVDKLQEFNILSDGISARIQEFVPGAKLRLIPIQPTLPGLPSPTTNTLLEEDGFEGTIDRTGHGLQRVLFFSLLRFMALDELRDQSDQSEEPPAQSTIKAESSELSTSEDDAENPGIIANLVIGIEEPELYQHPLQARNLSKVLLEMSEGNKSDGHGQNQILYTTHSAYFVGLERFGKLRIVRKQSDPDENPSHSCIKEYTYDEACVELARISGFDPGDCTEDSFRARAYPVMIDAVNEGFFANTVVVVEGNTEVAALQAVSDSLGKNLLAKGIAIIDVGGKTKIDKPVIIFRGFEIPTYYVFDADQDTTDKDNVNRNRLLLRLSAKQIEELPESNVNDDFAYFNNDFESYCEQTLGKDEYIDRLTTAAEKHGFKPKTGKKNFDVIYEFVSEVYESGMKLPLLDEIVNRVYSLYP